MDKGLNIVAQGIGNPSENKESSVIGVNKNEEKINLDKRVEEKDEFESFSS